MATNQALKQAPNQVTANYYQLHGHQLSVTYTTAGIDGQPSLEYQDAHQMLHFHGTDVRRVDSEIGQLVTVTIRRTVDTGSTSFTLLVPQVRLSGVGQQAPVTTQGITTIHRFSVLPIRGQTELYHFTALTGIAEMLVF